jgi:hypothetical protein
VWLNICSYNNDQVLFSLFLHLAFTDWREKVDKLNYGIKKSEAKVRQFSGAEFLLGLGLMIGAAEFAQIGKELFKFDDQKR